MKWLYLLAEVLEDLVRLIRRESGLIWLERKTKVVSTLPWPYKPEPKFTPRKSKPQTNWYKDVAEQAEASEPIISSRSQRIDKGGADSRFV